MEESQIRKTFHRELERLDQDVLRMAALAETAVEQVTLALTEGDVERAERVRAGDDAIDEAFVDMEQRALAILAQQQPVAADLRLVVAILRVIVDLERVGDLAHNVAGRVETFREVVAIRDVSTLLYQLGTAAQRLLGRAIDCWADKDVALAAELEGMDDEIDELYRRLVAAVFEAQQETSFEQAIQLVLVGRYFERIADHAVNMAERMRYFVTGDVEHLN